MIDTPSIISHAGRPSSGDIKVQLALASLLSGRVTSIADVGISSADDLLPRAVDLATAASCFH